MNISDPSLLTSIIRHPCLNISQTWKLFIKMIKRLDLFHHISYEEFSLVDEEQSTQSDLSQSRTLIFVINHNRGIYKSSILP